MAGNKRLPKWGDHSPVIGKCLGHVQVHRGGRMVRSSIRVLSRLHHGAGGRSSRRRGRRMMVTQYGRPGRGSESSRMIQLESSTHTCVHQLPVCTSTLFTVFIIWSPQIHHHILLLIPVLAACITRTRVSTSADTRPLIVVLLNEPKSWRRRSAMVSHARGPWSREQAGGPLPGGGPARDAGYTHSRRTHLYFTWTCAFHITRYRDAEDPSVKFGVDAYTISEEPMKINS